VEIGFVVNDDRDLEEGRKAWAVWSLRIIHARRLRVRRSFIMIKIPYDAFEELLVNA